MFNFLPLEASPYSSLNSIKDSIREKLLQEDIMPCQSYTTQKYFRKPNQVGRLKPAFWTLVDKARNQGVSFLNISSHGKYILNHAFDQEKYNDILKFLDVKYVEDEWYSRCIQSSDLVLGVSEDVYLELLLFVADYWGSFSKTSMVKIPLLKYLDSNLHVGLCSVNSASTGGHLTLFICTGSVKVSWLTSWNREFRCVGGYFIVESTQNELHCSLSKWQKVFDWLCSKASVKSVDVEKYAVMIRDSLSHDQKLVLAYAHFLYHSFKEKYLSATEIGSLCVEMPLVDDYGQVATKRKRVVVPANGSKWVQLLGSSNPWKRDGYVELGGEYLHAQRYAAVSTKKEELLQFLNSYAGVLDIPYLPPPDVSLSSMASPLTRENAFLLFRWIAKIKKQEIPERFLKCIREGSWLRVRLCGNPGYRPPSQSFLPSSSWGDHLQNGSLPVDIPLVDKEFYGDVISEYKESLRIAGVTFELKDACEYIARHFMSLAASSAFTKFDVISMLNFIRYLRDKFLPPDSFINSVKDKSWLQTTQGNRTPSQSVFLDKEWAAASLISNIPFVDQNHYGHEILAYKEELKLLGVIFGFNQNFQLVVSNLKPSANLTSLSAEAALLALNCIRHLRLGSSHSLCTALAGNRWLKTVRGYRSPTECFLPDPTWVSLLQVFDCFPCIDEKFYESKISLFKRELKMLGVVVSSENATKPFAEVFRQQASKSALSKSNALSFLECYKKIKANSLNLLKSDGDIGKVIQEVKWLRTRLGSASTPKKCILFGKEWKAISSVSLLPFLDEAYYDQGILGYKAELYSMGVTTTFRKGSKFVPAGLRLPKNPCEISPSVVCSLLLCLRYLQEDDNKDLISVLLEKLDHKWIKTEAAGYRSPKQCLLFGSSWNGSLKLEDGPFIDEKFYGSEILSYKKELQALGVVVEAKNGCSLVADYLDVHSNRDTINRIYTYLNDHGWVPTSDVSAKIWIPNGENSGKWVSPNKCVLHDKTNLFGSHLFVLEKYYSNELLVFFSRLGVNSNPTVEDYLKLWKKWECAERRLLPSECCAFWEFIVNHWSSKTQKLVAENLSKLPVCSGQDDGILLLDKNDVFIADDLYKKDLFEQSTVEPLFVWYPQPSLPSLPRTKLLNIYREIGVGALSESAQNMGLSSIDCAGLELANPDMIFIGKNLSTLILGFLAQPSLEIEAEKRHELVRQLVSTKFLKLKEPIEVDYRLSLSSGKIVIAKARRMMVWERERSKFFIAEIEKLGGYQCVLEYATYYSEEVSKGILWEKEDAVRELAELIRLGFIVKFDKVAISFLMKINNLQIFKEDELFLSSVFPAE
nr:Sacsin like [Ipomoea batatas]